MGNGRIIGSGLVAVVFALAAVAVRSANTAIPRPDDSGIGGVWEPYTVEAHSKMDGYFQSNGYEQVDVSDSGGDNQTYFTSEPAASWVGLDDSLDVGSIIEDLLTTTPPD